MAEYTPYCSKRDETCFTNLPLLNVISHWFRENNDVFLDFNPREAVYILFSLLISSLLIKLFFRIVKSMVKPLLFIGFILILLYTKQFSYSENGVEFISNVLSNIAAIVMKLFNMISRILGF